jgi:Uma2 family endonuclease
MAVAEFQEEATVDYLVTELPKGFEFVDGEFTEIPEMGFEASTVASDLHLELGVELKKSKRGRTFTVEASYRCFDHNPDQIRKPDVSVILCDPDTFVPPDPHGEMVPDLVVEVVSPHKTGDDLDRKIDDFHRAGTKLVWEIRPSLRKAIVHCPDLTTRQINEDGELSGEDVMPGFTLKLASVLPPRRG